MFSFNSISLVSLVYSSALLLSQVSAHGAITGLPTREAAQFHDGKDNEAGFPMDGSPTERPGGSCTKMAALSNPVKLPSGVDLTLPLMFRGGANHVGVCNIYLADKTYTTDGGSQGYSGAVKIATLKNCAQTLHPPAQNHDNNLAAIMPYNIPAKYNGQNKLLIWTLAATHLSETNPEYYDSCVDISVDSKAKDTTKYPAKSIQPYVLGHSIPFGLSAAAKDDYSTSKPAAEPGYGGDSSGSEGDSSGNGSDSSGNGSDSSSDDSSSDDSSSDDSSSDDSSSDDSSSDDSSSDESSDEAESSQRSVSPKARSSDF